MYSDGAFPSSTHLRLFAESTGLVAHRRNCQLDIRGRVAQGAAGLARAQRAHFTRSFETIAVEASPALCSSPRSRMTLFLR